MKNQRLDKLLEFYRDDASDPFIIYGIAMEYMNVGLEEARPWFEELISRFPDYLPTYYHAAGLFAELEETERALELYEKGIDLAESQGDHKTKLELQNAYQNLKFDLD